MARFSLVDMDRFPEHAWGELGRAIVEQWSHFNEHYFAGELSQRYHGDHAD